MPTQSGIKFDVVSQLELATHPEFPHPESSQFSNRSPKRKESWSDWDPPAAVKFSKADSLLGRNTTCSVYIPSIAGAQFWLRYNIQEAALKHSKYFYFKLFMNGRHIASWGVDAAKAPKGKVMQGLFDPDPRWNYEYDGEMWKNNGLEKRPFYFANAKDPEEQSVANDGGLIEILCFRASGRHRILPEPDTWRDQEAYGIASPSEGLYEYPEEAKFYDWHLKDTKNAPFIVFKFHYRSWESLELLELIPVGHPRTMIHESRELLPEDLQAILEIKSFDFPFLDTPHSPCTDCSPKFPVSESTALLNEVGAAFDDTFDETFDDTFDEAFDEALEDIPESPAQEEEDEDTFETSAEVSPLRIVRRRPSIHISKFSEPVIEEPTSANGPPSQTKIRNSKFTELLNRPLPELPIRRSPRRRHSRNSSIVSRSPSVTPSLMPYLDRDTGSPEPEVEVGVAKIVEVLYSSPATRRIPSLKSDSDPMDDTDLLATPPKIHTPEGASVSSGIGEAWPMLPSTPSLANPTIKRKPVPWSNPIAKRRGMNTPPALNIFSSGSMSNVTFRKHRRSTTAHFVKSNTADNIERQDEDDALTAEEINALSISESQWMCRSPSPSKATPAREPLQETASPTPIFPRNKAERIFKRGSALRRKSISWYRKARTNSSGSQEVDENIVHVDRGIDASESNMPPGNWI
ncbi:uncharacterized protein PAC_16125 [Phialocephala subalpina]|uniref:Uncharacterized protein n=1 Tax=Phialocephala subalpina TaxID=576137 RepID=A0A1L7XMI1_9HELO|nr:uncharacterized protein PAC_16125 [Phialocephala subalpina]